MNEQSLEQPTDSPKTETKTEEFDTILSELRTAFSERPDLQERILQILREARTITAPKQPQTIATETPRKEAPSTQTMEEILSQMYTPENYPKFGAKFSERAGVAGVMVTNESFFPERLQLSPSPDGYVIGTGNGAIWSMLELFPSGVLPKGIISLDYDPAVVLSGKVVVDLAKRGISREEAIAYFYGDYIDKPGGQRGEYFKHSIDEIVSIVKDIASREQNQQFRQGLLDAIDKGEFIKDFQFMRQRHEFDYKEPLFERGAGQLERKRRINTAAIIYKHWGAIVRLAQEGKIFFAHSDLGNEETLNFIETSIPDIETSRNILYTSNVVDFRYRREINGLQRFNPNGESWYIYTTQRPDDYALKASHSPPPYPSSY